MTISVCPSGCVCQAVRAPGSKVTVAPPTRAGAAVLKGESMRTWPVKYVSGPFAEGTAAFFDDFHYRLTFDVV
ncbi:Hypothetical Protein PANA_1943 [Pantoea ananatis LMG 20103]|uniref:Uncharacterized protein n=1 Tax=Pantoea ananatis (strain LMG 20103) TaxID=706191 RepID=D4GEY8_PANAM|nr:Hypothetical Protein PANA_1943 [Pantoea ananatis LMG 20103]